MPKPSTLTIYAFGLTSLIIGAINLVFQDYAMSTLGLSKSSDVQPASDGLALAAIAMGIYYTLAATQENRAFYILTVPMRLLTTAIFLRYDGAWKSAAIWEGTGASLTAIALVWENTGHD